MSAKAVIEQLSISSISEERELASGISSGKYRVVYREAETIKCRSFLLPIRSKIPVLQRQYEQTEFIIKKIEQSVRLVKTFEQCEESNCKILRVDLNKETYCFVFYAPETFKVYGVLIEVNKGYESTHSKLKSKDL